MKTKSKWEGYNILAKYKGFIAVDIPHYNRIDIVRMKDWLWNDSKATIYLQNGKIQIYAKNVKDMKIIADFVGRLK